MLTYSSKYKEELDILNGINIKKRRERVRNLCLVAGYYTTLDHAFFHNVILKASSSRCVCEAEESLLRIKVYSILFLESSFTSMPYDNSLFQNHIYVKVTLKAPYRSSEKVYMTWQ